MTGYSLFFCALVIATVGDLWKRKIPDTVHVLFLLSGLVQILGNRQSCPSRVIAFLLIGGAMLATGMFTGNLGGGDIKMAASMSFALGLLPALYVLFLSFFVAASVGTAIRLAQSKNVALPLAPFMAFGCLAVLSII